jgi:hypothetical protein
MRTLLWAVLSLCFCLSVVDALSQDAANQVPRKTQAAAGTQLTTIMGTVQEGGDKFEVRHRPKSLECGQSGDP